MLSAQLSSASWASAHQKETDLTGKRTSLQSWAAPRLPAGWVRRIWLLSLALVSSPPPYSISILPSLPCPLSLYFCPLPHIYLFLLFIMFPAFSLSFSSFTLCLPPFLHCHCLFLIFANFQLSATLPLSVLLYISVSVSLSGLSSCSPPFPPLSPHLQSAAITGIGKHGWFRAQEKSGSKGTWDTQRGLSEESRKVSELSIRQT